MRLDVWAEDETDAVYNVEAQKENTKNLPHRSRFYQALIDSKLLDPGEVDFSNMKDCYSIIIAPFDLFGRGLYQYTCLLYTSNTFLYLQIFYDSGMYFLPVSVWARPA